jgi:hypothetical protein
VVVGHHVYPILIFVIFFFFWDCLKDRIYNTNPQTEKLEENILREIANIPAEQPQRVSQNLFRRCEECLRVEGQHYQHLL